MTEWIVSSSVLIVIVALLRFLLKGKTSLRLQYALWALVLVRLLVPFNFGQSSFSVMNAVTVKQTEYYVWYTGDMGSVSAEPDMDGQAVEPPVLTAAPGISVGPNTGEVPVNTTGIQLDRILQSIWIAGIAVTAVLFLFSNLHFAVRLRRSRQRVEQELTSLPVYLSGAVETPCMFGLFRPVIYVTPEVLTNGTALRHVLAHETTHYRHGDHIWAFLRCVCLALHWYNPLVWWAASLSRRDGELACDEGTIKRIGEDERVEYGRTLISLTCAKHGALLTTATTMTGSKRSIKERITLIAKQPKTLILALIIAVAVCLAAVGFTFTSAEGDVPWAWARKLSVEDVDTASVWGGFSEYELSVEETEEVVHVINRLNRFDFAQNSQLAGPTPESGLVLVCGEEQYYMNQAGYLEMKYGGKQWWIKDKKLNDVVSSLLAAYSADEPDIGETPANSENDENEDNFTVLTEEEMAQVNKVLEPLKDTETGSNIVNPLWCFFTSYYNQPEDIDLVCFLTDFPYRQGIPKSESAEDQAELAALKAHEFWPFDGPIGVPIHKMPSAVVDEVLERYAGISSAELYKSSEDGRLLYLEEYDAYYNFTSDTGGVYVRFVRGEKRGNEIILYSNDGVLTLRKSEENYLIQSYLPV